VKPIDPKSTWTIALALHHKRVLATGNPRQFSRVPGPHNRKLTLALHHAD